MPSTPRRRFYPAADHSSGAHPRFRFWWKFTPRHDLSLSGGESLPCGQDPAAGSTLPAYIFEAILSQSEARSVFSSRPRPAFVQSGARSALEPVASSRPESALCPQASAPLQDFSILRDRSASPEFNWRNLPLWVARSSFAPRFVETFDRHETNQSPGSATSHQARCP